MKKILLGILLAVLLVLLFIWIGNESVLKHRGVTSDFYFFWFGGQSLLEQKSPYSAEATLKIQEFVFGGPLEVGEYSRPFPYPAYLALLFLPFGLLSYPAALPIWLSLQFPMLFMALYLFKRYLNLKLSKLELGLLFIAGSIGFFYPVISYSLGQLSILMLLLFVITFYFLHIGQPGWAGVSLALTSIRPDMFLIGCLVSVVAAWDSKKMLKVASISVLATFVAMNLITFFFIGFWYFDWIKILHYYSNSNPHTNWPLDVLPTTGSKIALVLILLAYLIWQIRQFLIAPTKVKKGLVISALFIFYLMVTKMTGSYNMTLLLIPLLILLYLYSQLKLRWIIWGMFFLPWAVWATLARSHPWFDQFLFPLSLLVLQAFYVLANMKRSKAGTPQNPAPFTTNPGEPISKER